MKTKNLIINIIGALMIIMSSNDALAQENGQNHELGIMTSNLSQFDVIYKKQKSENSFLRLRLASGSLSLIDTDPFKVGFDLEFAGGKEKRKQVSDNFYLVSGVELFCFLNSSISENPSFSITPGIGPVLGCTYTAKENILLGFELRPSVSWKFGVRNDDFFISDLAFNLSSTRAGLFIAYRFVSN